jgi:hypothetical protein
MSDDSSDDDAADLPAPALLSPPLSDSDEMSDESNESDSDPTGRCPSCGKYGRRSALCGTCEDQGYLYEDINHDDDSYFDHLPASDAEDDDEDDDDEVG